MKKGREGINDFCKNLLRSMGENNRSAFGIWKQYTHMFPSGFFRKNLNFQIGVQDVRAALCVLHKEGYVIRELVRYMEEETKDGKNVYLDENEEDTPVYRISGKGREVLHPKNKKK